MSSRRMRRIVLRLVFGGLGAVMVVFAPVGAHGAPAQTAQVLLPQVSVSSSAAGLPQTLFATGVADLPIAQVVQPPAAPTALLVSVSERSTALDRDAAVRVSIEKVAAVRAALEKAGVPSGNMVISNASVNPIFGGAGPGSPPTLQGYSVTESLQVLGLSPDKVDAVIQTALAAGAANANRNVGGPARSPQFDASAINQAVKQAAIQAKTMAQAGAEGLGVTLGSIRNVQVPLPSLSVAAPGFVQYRVSVTVTYDIRQP
jgi:uncharacterized protein YggE